MQRRHTYEREHDDEAEEHRRQHVGIRTSHADNGRATAHDDDQRS